MPDSRSNHRPVCGGSRHGGCGSLTKPGLTRLGVPFLAFLVLLVVRWGPALSARDAGAESASLSGNDIPGIGSAVLADAPATSELFNSAPPGVFPCGSASLAVAFMILGTPIVNDELAALADEKGNSNFQVLADYARSKGLCVLAVKLEAEQLLSLHNVAILQVRSHHEGQRMHFLVFAGPADANHVHVFDVAASQRYDRPVLLDRLAEDFTGKTLILSKYPIDVPNPQLRGLGETSGGRSLWPTVELALGAVLIAGGVTVLAYGKTRHCATARLKRTLLLVVVGAPAAVMGPLASAGAVTLDAGATRQSPNGNRPVESRYVAGLPTYSAGAVSVGTTLRHEFDIRNPDSQTVTIRLGKTSCSCLDAAIVGPSCLPPGAHSKVAVEVLTTRGGKTTQGVLLHVSTSESPVYLAISAAVKDDTSVSPGVLDFGAIAGTAAPESRPLRFTHYTDETHPFTILETKLQVPFLHVAGSGTPLVTPAGDGVARYEHSLLITLDPAAAPVGRFAAKLAVVAKKGETPLTFDIPCTGHILPLVVATPSQIVKILRVVPARLQVSVKLRGADRRKVVVASVQADAVEIVRWAQRRQPETGVSVLTLDLKPVLKNGRAQGTCQVMLAEPSGETVSLPVLIVQTKNVAKESD